MDVGIVDLGINNLTSVQRAFKTPLRRDDSIVVIDGNSEALKPDLIVLPGLGKFSAGMSALEERNLEVAIKHWAQEEKKIVAICLGMQLLGTNSDESPSVMGLDIIPSKIERLPIEQKQRIPHTGWAEANSVNTSSPFPSLQTMGDYYFVHSYHLVPENMDDELTRTSFGDTSFVSSVLSKNVLGVQFHPEKSGTKGKMLIAEIIQWARNED